MYDMHPERASDILRYAERRGRLGEDTVFVICGRGGPTGKSWLCSELQKAGHIAIEISDGINRFVDYQDNTNHMCESVFNQVIIVLNEPLTELWKL